ncbi:unnamed protein product [Owenia fusiformis]|uniref:Uncharacterized protein n=1 Tax=Owenia fusiformis TaxID=6347 RepID=A0A8J1YA53_OWEFU|nr:unnamed protein product [Owenia fusiformis]
MTFISRTILLVLGVLFVILLMNNLHNGMGHMSGYTDHQNLENVQEFFKSSENQNASPEEIMRIYGTFPSTDHPYYKTHKLHYIYFSADHDDLQSKLKQDKKSIKKGLHEKLGLRRADVILAGMFKGGTGTIMQFLNSHPQIVQLESQGYFSHHDRYILNSFQDHLKIKGNGSVRDDQLILERCTGCFISQAARDRLKVFYPDNHVKFLIMVRDPVDRLISEFTQNFWITGKNLSIEEAYFLPNGSINEDHIAIQKSIYVKHLALWYTMFPRELIYLVDADIFTRQPWVELNKIEQFIGVEHFLNEDKFVPHPTKAFYCILRGNETDVNCMGKAKGRTHPHIKDETIQMLKDYFKVFNEELFALAGKSFAWSRNY